MKAQEIYNYIDSFAPFNTAMGFDNAGLLVGGRKSDVRKIGVVLDITPDAVQFAVNNGIDLIVSHHPVIFTPLKHLYDDSVPFMLVKNGITAICAHTNLDAAQGGVNDTLADVLGLCEIKPLADPESPELPPLARIGKLKEKMRCDEFAKHTAKCLSTPVKAVISDHEIQTVAVCGGAGDDFILPAIQNGADALVTSDTKHHRQLLAKDLGLCLVDAGHFETENVIIPVLAKRLSDFAKLETIIIPQSSPSKYFF